MSSSRKRKPSQSSISTPQTPDPNQEEAEARIHSSPTIHDRGSSFTAIFSTSLAHLQTPSLLQQHASVREASHRILAWRKRKRSVQTRLAPGAAASPAELWTTGFDDDGEKGAGRRVERVLAEMGVDEGVCVVGRWFGGVLLGPVRFAHVERVVRDVVLRARQEGNGDGDEVKRVRLDAAAPAADAPADAGGASGEDVEGEGEEARLKLAQTLLERDESITVLRGLLAEKQVVLREMEGTVKALAAAAPSDSSSAKTAQGQAAIPGYDAMSASRLRALEKARDATLTWILRQIEVVEKKIDEAQGEVQSQAQEAENVKNEKNESNSSARDEARDEIDEHPNEGNEETQRRRHER